MKLKSLSINTFLVKKQFLICGIGALLGISIMYFVLLGESGKHQPTLFQSLSSIGLGIVLSYFLYFSSKLADTHFSFHKNIGLRFVVGILSQFVVSYGLIIGSIYLYNAYSKDHSSFYNGYDETTIKIGILVFISILLYQIIYFALYSYLSYTTYQIASIQQKRKQIELQLNALKSQLSPHFLFNCLNTVTSLIYKDEL